MRSGVSTVGEPKLDIDRDAGRGRAARFSIEVGVTPKAKLGDYKGLEVGRREPEVPADAIDQELERLRERSPASRASTGRWRGDLAVVDFVGRVDGEPSRAARRATTCSSWARARWSRASRSSSSGAGAGETRTIEIEFPEEYRAEDLAASTPTFEVEVKDVRRRSCRSSTTTLPPRRASSTPRRAPRGHRAQAAPRAGALDRGRVPRGRRRRRGRARPRSKLPDELVTARAEEMWDRTERMRSAQGLDPETYLQATGKTREEMVDETREDAAPPAGARERARGGRRRGGHRDLGRGAVGGPGRAAERERSKPEKLLERLQRNGRDIPLRRDLRLRKAVDVLAESAEPIDADTARRGRRSGRRTSSATRKALRSCGPRQGAPKSRLRS